MDDTTKPAYYMVQIKAKSLEELVERYGQFAVPTLQNFGGEMIAGSPAPKVVEGSWDGNWAAVLRFPSMEMAEAWYNSPAYRPLKELRINELQGDARILLL